jgi:hypothetical protein
MVPFAARAGRDHERLRRRRLGAVDRVGHPDGDLRRARLLEDGAARLARDRVAEILGQRRSAVELVVGLEAAARVARVPVDLDADRVDQAAQARSSAAHGTPRPRTAAMRAG